MLNISPELKELYKQPNVRKVYDIYFPVLDLHLNTEGTNDKLVYGSFELAESLCSSKDLIFGACEAAEVRLTVADIEQDLTGQWFTIHQIIEGYEPIPIGTFKVDSCKRRDGLRFKDIIGYNILAYIDTDVVEWYNGIFPTGNETYTLKQFRESLLDYLGIEYEDETLPNDSMIVEKTVDVGQLSAREVLRCCVELQGAFGQINRLGKFYHKVLQPAYGLYPAEDLYPSEDLYPVAEDDKSYVNETLINETIPRQQEMHFEEYTVKEIDKLIIRSEEDDIGAIVGTGSNAYIIQGNFLVFGKSAAELEQIARNAYGNMAKRPYRPYEAKCTGLPYIEPGDTVQINNYGDPVVGYVLQRTLTGIQALRDELKAEGAEQREQNFGVNNEIIQLKGRTTRIKKDVEGVRVEVENLEERTNTRFEQTDQAISAEAARAIDAETVLNGRIDVMAGNISAEVTRAINAETELSGRIDVTAEAIVQEVARATQAEGQLSGRIDVMAGQIVLKVDANGNVAAVELDADPSQGTNIKIKADNIQLEGLVTANGNFKVLPDGSIEAVNGKFSGAINGGTITGTNISGATIDGGTITGVTITGSTFKRTANWSGTTVDLTKIDDYGFFQYVGGGLTFQVGYYYDNGYIYSDDSGIRMGAAGSALNINQYGVFINGNTPITSANIGSQDVYSLRGTVYVSANGNFRPFISGNPSCGTADGKWSSVWAVNGTIQTSDERKKKNIKPLSNDDRFLRFVKLIVPYMYQMIEGTSGRYHVGFIAQRIEEAMNQCGISDKEFAGLIKSPVYSKKLKDMNGNELNEYDKTSEIIDYEYSLRYDEFIPLLFLWLRSLDSD